MAEVGTKDLLANAKNLPYLNRIGLYVRYWLGMVFPKEYLSAVVLFAKL